jgi:hypothetical protein
MLKVPGGGGGRALAVQDVHAPPEYVWDRILDFPNYKNMVPKVSDCYNYYTETMRNVGVQALCRMPSLSLTLDCPPFSSPGH